MKNKQQNFKHKNTQKNTKKESPKVTKNTQIFDDEKDNLFEGRNAVMELLNAEKTIHKLFIKQGDVDGSLKVILARAKEIGVIVVPSSREKLDEMSETGKHQGVIALCPPFEYAHLSDILGNFQEGHLPLVIILDKITDPHNFGAIIRTAAAANADAIIIPKRRSVGITAAVVRASAGAVSHIPVARVSNISQTIDILKKQGFWVTGAQMGATSLFSPKTTPSLRGATALVVGSEGEGLSRLIEEKCDFLVSIPMSEAVASLNVSVAAGILMYEAVRQRQLNN